MASRQPMMSSPAVLAVHRLAMEAKQTIFRAQDAEGRVDPGAGIGHPMAKLSGKLRRRLARVRAELEALDRDVRGAMEMRAPLGSSEPVSTADAERTADDLVGSKLDGPVQAAYSEPGPELLVKRLRFGGSR